MKKSIFFLFLFTFYLAKGQFKTEPLNYFGVGNSTPKCLYIQKDGSTMVYYYFHSKHPFCSNEESSGSKYALVIFEPNGEIRKSICFYRGTNMIESMIPLPNGDVMLAGYSNRNPKTSYNGTDIWLWRVNSDGETVSEFFVGEPGKKEVFKSIAITPNGEYIIGAEQTEIRDKEAQLDVVVMKVSNEGELEWKFTKHFAFWEHVNTVVPLRKGGYLIGGLAMFRDEKKRKNHPGTALLFKLDEAGQLIWKRNYGKGYFDFIAGMVEHENGDIAFIGRETSSDRVVAKNCGRRGFWLVRLDEKGRQKWENFLISNATGRSVYGANSTLQITPDECYLVGGNELSDLEASKLWLAKFGPDGKLLWQYSDKTSICHSTMSIQKASNGYIAGGWVDDYRENGKVMNTWTMPFTLKQGRVNERDYFGKIDKEYEGVLTLVDPKQKREAEYMVKEPNAKTFYKPQRQIVQLELSNAPSKKANIRVTNKKGKEIFNQTISNAYAFQLKIEKWKPGEYLIELEKWNAVRSWKLIKKY